MPPNLIISELLPRYGSFLSLYCYFRTLIQNMAEDLKIVANATREEQYTSLIPQLEGLLSGEDDLIANLANIAAALKEQFNWLWVGFYLVKNGELVLGPFQGPVACTRIHKGRGVCGTAWERGETILVPDVDQFPGHIACSSASKSEVVVPLYRGSEVVGVLDVDSEQLAHFDEIDSIYLNKIVKLIYA
jgi:GAF domain-containing protein